MRADCLRAHLLSIRQSEHPGWLKRRSTRAVEQTHNMGQQVSDESLPAMFRCFIDAKKTCKQLTATLGFARSSISCVLRSTEAARES